MEEDLIMPLGTMVTSSHRGFPRDYILVEDFLKDKKLVWLQDEDGELYQFPTEGLTRVIR